MGDRGNFPTTRWSAIVAAGSGDDSERFRASEWIATFYWKPIYKYIRVKWHKSSEDSKDLTQGFFALAFEKGYFASYDPSKGRFRTFVRSCVDGFVANEGKAAHRIKRGGDLSIKSLDVEGAEREIRLSEPPNLNSIEDYFYKEWLRSLFSLAVEALRQECAATGKITHFQLFERYDLDEGDAGGECSYATLAEEFHLPLSQVTNYLAYIRRSLRRIVLEKLREITADDEEFRKEARSIFGSNLP